tara:strand:+ start:130 stop:525 length:396 start_codon:yes stop_codon:yes gene_type:complete
MLYELNKNKNKTRIIMVMEMLTMTIIRMVNDTSENKVVAYFDVDINGLLVRGFKLINGMNGLFVKGPSQKGKDGEWYDICFIQDPASTLLLKKAEGFFNPTGDYPNNKQQQKKEIPNGLKTATTPSDDLPF